MAPNHREDSFVVLQIGEQSTLVKFGLDDPLSLPSHRIPTRVYSTAAGVYSMNNTPGASEIRPLKLGRIVDLGALQFLIKAVLNSFLKQDRYQHIDLDQIHLLLVQSSMKWSHLAIEKLINYLFEGLSLHNVSLVPLGLCSMFAYGSYPNSLVVDIGYNKCEILPIVDYEVFSPASRLVKIGGDNINVNLKRLLPNLSDGQIEDLKKSDIFECLSAEDAKRSFFGVEGLVETNDHAEGEDEGVLDIASIVTSEKSTREILETVNSKVNKKNDVPNSELETNSFIDSNGEEVQVGKERFQGCLELIDAIVFNIYWGLECIPDPKKRQDCYENIIFSGQTTKLSGFKELVMFKLAERYLITTQKIVKNEDKDTAIATAVGSVFRNTLIEIDDVNIRQAPRHLRMIVKPDYFIEWKKHGFEDCSFLGAQILSKQVFNNNNGLSLNWSTYQEEGPSGIWNVRL